MKKILLLFIILLLLPTVVAQEYSQGEDLYVFFYNASDGIIYDTNKCYLTLKDNDDNTILTRINMTNAGQGRYNWTINTSLPVNLTKPYLGMVNCSTDAAETDNWVSWESFYIVGSKSTNMSYAIALVAGTGLAAFFFAYIGMNFKNDKIFDQVLKIFFVSISVILAVATLGLGAGVASEGGAGSATQGIADTIAANSTMILYFFLAMIMLSFFIGVILYFAKAGKKPRGA